MGQAVARASQGTGSLAMCQASGARALLWARNAAQPSCADAQRSTAQAGPHMVGPLDRAPPAMASKRLLVSSHSSGSRAHVMGPLARISLIMASILPESGCVAPTLP